MRKKISFCIVLMLIIACSVAAAAESTELELWTFVDAHADFYQMKAEEWNEVYPDKAIDLQANVLPFDQMHDQLSISLQTGLGLPDIVDIEIAKFSGILENNIDGFVNLTPMIDEYSDDIVVSRTAPYSSVNGNVYGIPTHMGTFLMFYNEELFEQAGVSIDDIETWDDYIEAGKKLTQDTNNDGNIDQWMLAVPSEEAISFEGMSNQLGSSYFDEDGNVVLDREENIMALQYLQDFVYEYEIAEVISNFHEPHFYDALNNGRYASIFMPQWYMIRFTDFMPDLEGKIKARPLPAWPTGGTRSTVGGGTGTAVTKGSDNVDIAKEFLAFAKLTKEAGIQIWTELGFDPIRIDAYEDELFKEEFPYFGNEQVMQTIQGLQSDIQPVYYSSQLSRLLDILMEETLFEVIENNADVEDALINAANQLR